MDERETVLQKIEGDFGTIGREIVAILYDTNKSITLEEIEEALVNDNNELDPKEIRQILYQLQDNGYARSRSYRNDETGWISFLWVLFPEKILK